MSTKLQPWQVTNSKVVHQTPWIEVIEDTCQAQDQELHYTYTKRVDEGPLIIAETAEHKLWLVRQYRHPIRKIIWQFPAEGKISGESWEAAAARGLREELHLEAKRWQSLGEFHPDPGGLQQKYQAFLAQDLKSIEQGEVHHVADEVEELERHAFSRTEIDALIDRGEICDNWTLAGLYLYDRYQCRA